MQFTGIVFVFYLTLFNIKQDHFLYLIPLVDEINRSPATSAQAGLAGDTVAEAGGVGVGADAGGSDEP